VENVSVDGNRKGGERVRITQKGIIYGIGPEKEGGTHIFSTEPERLSPDLLWGAVP